MIKALISVLYGFVAGMTAALVLWGMGLVSRLVWSGPDTRWYIFAVILVGGGIIALLRGGSDGLALSQQIEMAGKPASTQMRKTGILALTAIVAVGFGGAVGPEAGILAVVAELSVLVTAMLARLHHPGDLVGEIGAAGALGGLYGSPPGAALLLDDKPQAPKWQLYAAALAGLAGFLIVARRILPENALHVDLPSHVAAGDGSEIILAVFPAMLGTAMGWLFLKSLTAIRAGLSRCGALWLQTMIGTALFALLAATFPILRFSGHHELHDMLHWGQEAGLIALLALAALKVLALSLCLASGWRGGAAFPLIFAGAAAGAAAIWLLPHIPVTVALVAGIGGALTVGMGKPLATMLIALLLIGPVAMGPLCTGLLIGWLVSRQLPKAELH